MTWAETWRSAARQRLSLRKTHCRRYRMYRDAGKHELARVERDKATSDYGVVRDYLERAHHCEEIAIG